MNVVKATAIVIVVVAAGLLVAGAAAQAYDFANICPAQAPPKWAVSAEAWSQFVDSCVTNDASARAGRAFDRHFWDNCIKTCGLANDAEGRIPPKAAQPDHQSTTSGTPVNPNWCSDVPASPAPPHFENHPGDWAYERSQCLRKPAADAGCVYACQGARELWARAKAGTLNVPEAPRDSTTVPQGPFPLPGGGSGYIVPLPTPVAPLNPNWCSQVPASPPPPYFEHHPGAWAAERQMCMNLDKNDRACASICINAIDRWNLQKAGRFNQPDTFPSPTDQPQGPFPLPGGANGYILPVQPAPAPGGPTSQNING